MSKIKAFFKKHFIVRDTIFVILLCCTFNIVFKRISKWELANLLLENAETIFPIFFNAGITLVGCLLTGISVLVAFLDKSQLERFKTADLFNDIFGIFFNALLFCGIFTILGLWGLIAPGLLVSRLASITIILIIARIWRCIWIFKNLIEIICKP
jgi:hypothetical protein